MRHILLYMGIFAAVSAGAAELPAPTEGCLTFAAPDVEEVVEVEEVEPDTVPVEPLRATLDIDTVFHYTCPYFLPYSLTYSEGNWRRLWLNTAVLSAAFVSTLGVLELLPEDATAWNRADIQRVAPFNRWYRNIFKWGPEWDHDNAIFNYVLHPYAGAAYFMGARSCGFNFYQSLLYSALISTVEWEFGIEAFMERPSYQDLVITPVVGSVIGECFYRLKRHIVQDDYRLAGSPVLGNVVAFLIDPVNEVIGLFAGNDCRRPHPRDPYIEEQLPRPKPAIETTSSQFYVTGESFGIAIKCVF